MSSTFDQAQYFRRLSLFTSCTRNTQDLQVDLPSAGSQSFSSLYTVSRPMRPKVKPENTPPRSTRPKIKTIYHQNKVVPKPTCTWGSLCTCRSIESAWSAVQWLTSCYVILPIIYVVSIHFDFVSCVEDFGQLTSKVDTFVQLAENSDDKIRSDVARHRVITAAFNCGQHEMFHYDHALRSTLRQYHRISIGAFVI
jgi:hypothetical protein